MAKPERIVVYIPKPIYQALRVKLLTQGKTVSGWFREKVTKFLKEA